MRHFARPAGVFHRNSATPLWLMATSCWKKFAGSQLATAPTGSTTMPTMCSTIGMTLTTASHTKNPAVDFGSVAHTAAASTMHATVNGRAAPMPCSR